MFKIIPMQNPDGVIVGNYRCALTGSDLNRQWLSNDMTLNPVNYKIKSMIGTTLHSREIELFCDFHGHSRAHNVFIYGNNGQN